MKIYSEITGKEYASVDECLAAEKAHNEKVAAEEARKAELAETRKERAKEVEEAYETMLEAKKAYNALLDAFLGDYGSFHMTYKNDNKETFPKIFNNLFDFMF